MSVPLGHGLAGTPIPNHGGDSVKGIAAGNVCPKAHIFHGFSLSTPCRGPAGPTGHRLSFSSKGNFRTRMLLASSPRLQARADPQVEGGLLAGKTRGQRIARRSKCSGIGGEGLECSGPLGMRAFQIGRASSQGQAFPQCLRGKFSSAIQSPAQVRLPKAVVKVRQHPHHLTTTHLLQR